MTFGRAGPPLSDEQATADHLAAMKARPSVPALQKTDDLLSQRVSEELNYAGRLLETVEKDLAKRGVRGPIVDLVGRTEQMLVDLSGVVDAKDRCDGIERIEAPDMKRRMLRRDMEGRGLVCKPETPGEVPRD